MSRVYFHSIDKSGIQGLLKDATVSGAELAHLRIFVSDVAWAIIQRIADESTGRRSILRNAFPPEHYTLKSDDFSRDASLAFRVGDDPLILGEERIDTLDLKLNTACYLGSDQVRFGARLYGQCEIHAYVEGPNRKWLADIIRQGRTFEFFRSNEGWESVIQLLEEDDSTPIVTSYSICNSFPNEETANFVPPLVDGEKNWDAFYELSAQDRWDMGMIELRKREAIGKYGLEMKPDNWNDFYFGDGMDANQFVVELRKLYPED